MEYIREATKFDIDEISNMNQDFPVSECHNVMNINYINILYNHFCDKENNFLLKLSLTRIW